MEYCRKPLLFFDIFNTTNKTKVKHPGNRNWSSVSYTIRRVLNRLTLAEAVAYRLRLPEQVLVGGQDDAGQQTHQGLVGEDQEHLGQQEQRHNRADARLEHIGNTGQGHL